MTRSTPEKAVILAAGLGSRLRPLTDDRPKPLVEVNGVPILYNALAALEAVGVKEVTIVVGYRKEAIQRACGSRFGGIDIRYVESGVFDRTGSAYSLWLARETLLAGDVFLLEGDVFFDNVILSRLLDSPADVAAIDRFDETMTGSAVFLDDDGAIREFRMNQSAADIGPAPMFKTVNLFRFTAPTLQNALVPMLDDLMSAGQTKSYVEQVLAQLVEHGRLRLDVVHCDDVRWFEIDSESDLRIAEEMFAPEGRVRPLEEDV